MNQDVTIARETNGAGALGPVSLTGNFIYLEPMRPEHAKGILDAGRDFDWAWMTVKLENLESVRMWIAEAQGAEARGEDYPFVVRERRTEKIIGCTRYMDTHPKQMATEIGWTWYSPSLWGTVVNPECKLLLLAHAFDDWGAVRVQLKTDNNNIHSQRAILKLGAKYEGRLRSHRFRADGTLRDTMMYSILLEEWPEVKASLLKRIQDLTKKHSG